MIKGTRVPMRTLLASLAEGASRRKQIVADFPTVGLEDIRAVIAFAAAAVKEDLPMAEMPAL